MAGLFDFGRKVQAGPGDHGARKVVFSGIEKPEGDRDAEGGGKAAGVLRKAVRVLCGKGPAVIGADAFTSGDLVFL
jgi:hypothetical protein